MTQPTVTTAAPLIAALAILLVGARPVQAASDCSLPTGPEARRAHLASMAGFAATAGTVGGLEYPLFQFSSAQDDPQPRPGTLRAALEAARAAGGGWIVPAPSFPAGAEIALAARLQVPPNTTLDGGCRGLRIVGPPQGSNFGVPSENVVLTRLILRSSPENLVSSRPGDCITIGGGADRVWVAYNSFGRCGDGATDVTQSYLLPTPTRVTLAFNRYADHDKVVLLATLECAQRVKPEGLACPSPVNLPWDWSSGVQATLQGNLFYHTGQRHPRVGGRAYAHVVDQVVIYRPFLGERGSYGASYGSFVSGGGRALIDHTVFAPVGSGDRRRGAAFAARVDRGRDPGNRAGTGALRLLQVRAEGGAQLDGYGPEWVPDPPYRLAGRLRMDEPLPRLVEEMERCTGPEADPVACGHVRNSGR